MRLKWIISATVLSIAFMTTEAKIKFNVGVETGYQLYVGEHIATQGTELEVSEDEQAPKDRKHLSNYNPAIPTDDESYLHCLFGGVTGEFLWNRERYGITTGLRYTQFIDRYDFDEPQTEAPEGETQVAPISNRLLQRTHYLGFPLEFRYLTSKAGRPCRFYFKLGTSWNFLMATDNRLTSTIPSAGEEIETEPTDVGREPDYFIGTIYPAIGFRIFRRFPLLNVEMHLPSFVVNMPTSYFAYNIGVGLSVSVQFPVSTKDYKSILPLDIPCLRIKSARKRTEWVQPRE